MEEVQKDSSSASGTTTAGKMGSRLLRYPLRSAAKSKEDKPPLSDTSNYSASATRGKNASTVSKSVGVLDLSGKQKSANPSRRLSIPAKPSISPSPKLVSTTKSASVLDLSGKEKSAKPPRRLSIPASMSKSASVLDVSGKEKSAKSSRRLSIPAKSSVIPSPKLVGNITPISAAKSKNSSGSKGDVPVSGVTNRRKFNMLSSATYWQSQIKVSEAAGKHFISLGFFKLALEAECEPIQLLRDELKLYVRRHDLTQFGESLKELSERYSITEEFEQLQVSETCSHVPEEETRSSDDDARSSLPVKSKSPTNGATKKSHQGKVTNKETAQKNEIMTKPRRTNKVDASDSKGNLKSETGSIKQKKTQKPKERESKKVHDSLEKQGKESPNKEGPNDVPSAEHELNENKENVDAVLTEDLTELEA